MDFFRSKADRAPAVDLKRLPRHIAIIMDGNGRWAKNEECRVQPATPPARRISVP